MPSTPPQTSMGCKSSLNWPFCSPSSVVQCSGSEFKIPSLEWRWFIEGVETRSVLWITLNYVTSPIDPTIVCSMPSSRLSKPVKSWKVIHSEFLIAKWTYLTWMTEPAGTQSRGIKFHLSTTSSKSSLAKCPGMELPRFKKKFKKKFLQRTSVVEWRHPSVKHEKYSLKYCSQSGQLTSLKGVSLRWKLLALSQLYLPPYCRVWSSCLVVSAIITEDFITLIPEEYHQGSLKMG